MDGVRDGVAGPELSAAEWSWVISHEGKEGMILAASIQREVLFFCKAP